MSDFENEDAAPQPLKQKQKQTSVISSQESKNSKKSNNFVQGKKYKQEESSITDVEEDRRQMQK